MKKPSKQVNAAYEMGRVEARVSVKDGTLRARDLWQYLRNAETAYMMASDEVLKYILDKEYFGSGTLKIRYDKYRAKYWKSNIKITKK